mmetsp:Transcript_10040/g.23228  ORF Transcript_10040/g.23228 Transcript_10040/m.23228 type:complete len:87 (-) Transcript_10040:1174-1434(-)
MAITTMLKNAAETWGRKIKQTIPTAHKTLLVPKQSTEDVHIEESRCETKTLPQHHRSLVDSKVGQASLTVGPPKIVSVWRYWTNQS